jgi:Na+/proline symporter
MTIWFAFLAYSALALWLGWRAARAGTARDDFWTAGRSLRGADVGISLSAGFLSISWSCVYAVQLFYWYGLGALWLMTIPWLCALGAIYWLARRYHGLAAFSQPEMIEQRFGTPARRITAGALATVFLIWGGAEIYVAANLLAPQMHASETLLILLLAAVVGAYSTMGGFRAVVDTDKLQYGVVTAYLLAMAWLAQRGLAGAAGTVPGVDPEVAGARLLLEAPLLGAMTGTPWLQMFAVGGATIVLTFLAYLPGWAFETDLWVRVQAARTPAAARRGVLFAAANSLLFIGLLPAFIGGAAMLLFPTTNGVFPPELGNEADAVFAALVTHFAPGWLAVIVAVGLVAAAMSTIDTCTNVMALSIAYDLVRVDTLDDAAAARWSRRIVIGCTAAAAMFAMVTDSLWDIFYLSSGILTTAVAFPIAAVFLPWATRRAVTWSSVAGLTATPTAYFLEARGPLTQLEPAWMAGSGLGYIAWGIAAAAVAAAAGVVLTPAAERR